MSESKALSLAIAAVTALAAFAASEKIRAEPARGPSVGAITPAEAVRLALSGDPSHAAVLAAKARAVAAHASARARLTPLFSAGLDYTRATSPSLGQRGVLVGEANLVTGRAGLSHQFVHGTAVSAELALRIDERAFVSPILNAPLRIGPGYGVSLRVMAVQPLLRGRGEALGRLPEASSAVSADAATRIATRAASELARASLTAHAELALAERALTLRVEAVAIATRAVDEARLRVAAGDLAPPDALPLEAERAAAEEALVTAETALAERQLALGRLIGWPLGATDALRATPLSEDVTEPPPPEVLVAAALANAGTLAERDAAVRQAELAVVTAEDRLRMRLDATAWVEAAGLGDKDPAAALGMWGGLQAVSAFVGLALELPTSRTQLLEDVAAARHAREEALQRRVAEVRAIESEARAIAARWAGALRRRGLAARTLAAAEAAADAWATRREAGAATTLGWLQMTREAHAARLRVVSLSVETRAAELAACHAMGTLLDAALSP
jgi:outer membrane protein TolC